jgi:hypothetical protein
MAATTNTAATDEFDAPVTSGGFGTFDASSDDDADMVIDFTNISDKVSFEVWPRGVYDGVVDDVQYGNSQRSGNPMLTWQIRAGNPNNEGRERTFYYHTTLIDSGLTRTKRALSALAPHANVEFDITQFRPSQAAELFVGAPCRIRLNIQTYEGQKRNSVADLLPAIESGDGFMS